MSNDLSTFGQRKSRFSLATWPDRIKKQEGKTMWQKSKIVILMAVCLGLLVSCSIAANGEQGPPGVGINNIINNGDGTFTINLTDGSSYTVGNFTGPQGIQGPQGPPGLSYSPMQIALLRWYEANQAGITFSVGSHPQGICFDGANIWVANLGSDNVTKLKASDGSLVGTYAVGSSPFGICFDGANIWVANFGSDNVTKLKASDGSLVGTYAVGSHPLGICFDGANIWVANEGSNTVSKL
jgi:DNA-binding beta-propeller fold protein YncE